MSVECELIQRYAPSQRSLERVTLRQILTWKLWHVINVTLFRWSWRFCGLRRALMRFFGAHVSDKSSISPKSRIDGPGNVTIGALSSVGAGCWIYAWDKIEIGEKCCISEGVRLLTGTHDFTTMNFQFITKPIRIGSAVWLATDAIVLPGVTIGDGAVVGAGSVVTKDVAPWTVVGGNPARFIKKRELKA